MRAVPVVALLTCVCASRRPSTVNTLLKETFPRMGVFTLLMGRRAGRGGDSVDDGDDGVDRGVIDVIPPAADAFSPPLAPLPFPFPLPLPPLPRPRDVPLRHMLPPLAPLPHAHLHVQEERPPPLLPRPKRAVAAQLEAKLRLAGEGGTTSSVRVPRDSSWGGRRARRSGPQGRPSSLLCLLSVSALLLQWVSVSSSHPTTNRQRPRPRPPNRAR